MKKQKLEQRTKTNTPTGTPQARGNCGLSLNKEETLSVASLKTRSNIPEVDKPQHIEGLKANVYVLSIAGNPLMPCSKAKARKLLRDKKAKIAKLYPFTIQLNFECENQVQGVKLGEDSGDGFVGISCVTAKKEVFSATLTLDQKTSSRLTEKRMYRRARRSKLWYRKPRFLNRNKPEGWLPPSTQRKYDAHLKLINLAKSILPISETTIEVAKFDIAKIENPEIEGNDYQQGDMYGYQNMRSYLMSREKGLCQVCKKPFGKGQPSHVHHCKQRNEEGSNKAKNLAILHKKCHEKIHKKGLKLSAPKKYSAPTFMSIVNKRMREDLPEANFTYGYITFIKRNELGLEKTHATDAFVIAGGTTQERCEQFNITHKHRNNRAIQMNRKGFAPAIRKQRYEIQPKDFIWIDGKKHVVNGTHCKGTRVIVEGTKKSYPAKNIEKQYNFGTFAFN